MKTATGAAAAALILCGCGGTMQWTRAPEVSDADCTASCNAHFEQCPQVFAAFPERGAVECPAEHNNCLKTCAKAHPAGHIAAAAAANLPPAAPPVAPTPVAAQPAAAAVVTAPVAAVTVPVAGSRARPELSKEAKLRELKHFHDEGLVTEDVYRERQRAILAEP
jgi:hypothetical protein